MLVKLNEMTPFINSMFETGKKIEISITGTSMLPLLLEKRDSVVLTKINRKLKAGEIILYKRCSGQYVLHRIYKIKEDKYFLIGDNQTSIESGINIENIIAVVSAFTRNGKKTNVNNLLYKIWSFVWIKIVPLRRYIFKIFRR